MIVEIAVIHIMDNTTVKIDRIITTTDKIICRNSKNH